jgi:outer membrane protein assembly factor BamB
MGGDVRRAVSILVLLTVIPAIGSSGAATFVNWPAYLHGAAHPSTSAGATAITPANAASLTHAWTWKPAAATMTGQPAATLAASPTVVDGVIYIGANTGVFYAIDESTGTAVWHRFLGFVPKLSCNAGKGFTGTATVANDPATGKRTVYVGSADGYLYALDASTGTTRWRALVAAPSSTVNDYYLWGSPTVAGGRVYIGISSQCDNPLVRGGVRAFNQSDGSAAATYHTVPSTSLGGSVWSSPALNASGAVFVSTGNNDPNGTSAGDSNSIVRLSPTLSRQSIWTVPAAELKRDDDFGASPSLFTASLGGTATAMVGACNKNGRYYALRAGNLAAGPVWKLQAGAPDSTITGDACLAASVWDGAHLFIASNQTTIGGTTYFGSLRKVSPATGAPIWQTGLPGAVMGTPALDGSGVLAAASYDGASGATNAAYLLNASNGQLLRTIATGAREFAQPVFADNMLLLATINKGLIAYRVP